MPAKTGLFLRRTHTPRHRPPLPSLVCQCGRRACYSLTHHRTVIVPSICTNKQGGAARRAWVQGAARHCSRRGATPFITHEPVPATFVEEPCDEMLAEKLAAIKAEKAAGKAEAREGRGRGRHIRSARSQGDRAVASAYLSYGVFPAVVYSLRAMGPDYPLGGHSRRAGRGHLRPGRPDGRR